MEQWVASPETADLQFKHEWVGALLLPTYALFKLPKALV